MSFPPRSVEPIDVALAARARAGDREAFGGLFRRHHAALLGFFERRVRNREAARDAAQETFARAFARVHTLEAAERVRGWLFGFARNVLHETWRAARAEPVEPPDPDALDESPESLLLDRELDRALADALADALARLPQARRGALLLRVGDELDYREIGQRLGWRVGKVKNELHRARARLRATAGLRMLARVDGSTRDDLRA